MPDKTGDPYLDTISRLESEIAMIDDGAGFASIAISLKRIADALDGLGRLVECLSRPPLLQEGEDGEIRVMTETAGPLWTVGRDLTRLADAIEAPNGWGLAHAIAQEMVNVFGRNR